MKRLFCIIAAVSLLLSLCACGKEPAETTVAPSTTIELPFVQEDPKAVALSTEHFSVTKEELTYLYSMVLDQYAYYLTYIGIDTTKSLKDQLYTFDDSGDSWFTVLMEEAVGYARTYLDFAEEAYDRGLTLDEDNESTIAENKAALESAAASYGWDVDTYLGQYYETNISYEAMEGVMKLVMLSQKGYTAALQDVTFSEAEWEAEFNSNLKKYALIDFYYINLDDGEAIPEGVKPAALAAYEAAGSYEDFAAATAQFLEGARMQDQITEGGGLDAYTESYLKDHLRTGVSYTESDFMNWAFGDEAKEGGVFVQTNDDNNTTYAYYLVKTPYRDMTRTIDVRHILFKLASYNGKYATADAAHAQAETVLQTWLSGGGTLEKFIELCAEYSEDGTANTGGLYEKVNEGDMVAQFNDWCFDESRQPGDYGIVDTTYGAHIMYFVGSHLAWETSVDDALFDDYYNRFIEEREAKTPVTQNDDVIDSVNW